VHHIQGGNHVTRFGPDDDIDPQVDLDGKVETSACSIIRYWNDPRQ
jgi:hypothetical protein